VPVSEFSRTLCVVQVVAVAGDSVEVEGVEIGADFVAVFAVVAVETEAAAAVDEASTEGVAAVFEEVGDYMRPKI